MPATTSTMSALLWKEWREQRWALGFGSLLLTAFAWVGLRARLTPDETLLSALAAVAGTLLPVLATTGLVPAERADGTLDAMLALPVRRWKVLAAKTLSGVALCAGPLAAAAAVSMLAAGGREMPTIAMLGIFVGGLDLSLALLAWMLLLTMRSPTEARAALVSIGVVVAWLIVSFATQVDFLTKWVWWVNPFSIPLGSRLSDSLNWGYWPAVFGLFLAGRLVVAGLLWTASLAQYTPSAGRAE